MKVYLTATLRVNENYLEEVKPVLLNMVAETRKEKACLQYDLHQGTDDPATFVFYEIWENQEGLDLHNKQPYIQNFGAFAADKIEIGPVLLKLQKI
ncbi:putative quinol monooxygenase [Sphingobacterium sp. Mn56C]|uniref:putative quinol monooxygenase n=1 Tax=Sphingobacterium sp. Mn56C TaxID=3395261 RepID=UPI003BDCD163